MTTTTGTVTARDRCTSRDRRLSLAVRGLLLVAVLGPLGVLSPSPAGGAAAPEQTAELLRHRPNPKEPTKVVIGLHLNNLSKISQVDQTSSVDAYLYLGWTDERVWEYINKNGLPRSPAYKTLHISGDCLCGSFAKKEEAGMIQMFYPGVAQQIEALEAELDASGHKHNRWGRTGLTETRTQKKQTPLSILCAECDILSSEDK